MEMSFLSSVLSLSTLLVISVFTFLLSKKINFPYTVLLVVVGLLLVPLSNISYFSFIDDFQLTPDILFYVFLPVLLFEAAYTINYRQIIKNWKSIFGLAVIGLIISTFIIGLGLFYILPLIGINLPFLACLLFGALISATDPVAVLALFKSMGAPRRLTLIFEGESLFNDGTALALFLVILGIIVDGGNITPITFIEGFASFCSMAIGGILFGIFTGVLFSKMLQKIKNDETLEITLTMVVAHLTFISSELISEYVSLGGFEIKISGVISTTIAAIIIGNYGRYKISPKVEEYMEKFWGFFAFIANSLVFILLGLMLSYVNIDFYQFILPIFLSIVVIIIARATSVYLPIGFLNFFHLEEKIPSSWQHLLSWGSLRGALALMMVLMVPDDLVLSGWNMSYSIKDFLLVITIGAIMFTLFIKAPTITPMMRKFGTTKLHDLEEVEYEEGKILTSLKSLEKINSSYSKGYMIKEEFDELIDKYENILKNSIENIKKLLKNSEGNNAEDLIRRTISLHALGIEKQHLKELFAYNEIDEHNFKHILHKISRQVERIEQSKTQIKTFEEKNDYDFYEKMVLKFQKEYTYVDEYIRNRAKLIITRKVIKEMQELKEIDFGFDKKIFDELIDLYEKFNVMAEDRKTKCFTEHKINILGVEARLMEKSIFKLEEKVIEELFEKEIITPKLYHKFIEEIEENIYKDVRNI